MVDNQKVNIWHTSVLIPGDRERLLLIRIQVMKICL